MSVGLLANKKSTTTAKAQVTAKPGSLRMGESNDSFEQEANRVANEVTAGSAPKPAWSLSRMGVDTPARPKDADSADVPEAMVRDVLRSPGKELDASTRATFGSRFGYEFGGVRVHADSKAAASARAIDAAAYTVGHDLVFGAGQYSPHTPAGHKLLAHELTHAVQQGSGTNVIQRQMIPVPGSPVPLAGPYTGYQPFPPPPPVPVQKPIALIAEINALISTANWKDIRKRVYPAESAEGIKRAKNRKAGTEPDLKGLGRIKSLESFAAAIHNVQKKWGKSPAERLKMLGAAANSALSAADVPGFTSVEEEDMFGRAYFSSREWKMVFSTALINQASLGDAEAADLANTALHESRHAEQHFLAARYAAGVNKEDAATIHAGHDIPQPIADIAVAKKFDSKTDPALIAMGKDMVQSMVTDGQKNQDITDAVSAESKKLDSIRADTEAAVKKVDATPTTQTIADATKKRDALRAQIAAVEAAYKGYRAIPHEAGAHEVGDAEEQAFKGWK